MEYDTMDKFTLCIMPTQNGKTFQTINYIMERIMEETSDNKTIHFVFTMNTILGNKQFADRIAKAIQKFGKNSVCIFNSEKNMNLRDVNYISNLSELKELFFDGNIPRVIIMCSNTKRFENITSFLEILDKKDNRNISGVYLYYDELHKYINNKLRTKIEKIHNLNITNNILALTATPEKIFSDNWKCLKQMDIREINDDDYCGYKEISPIIVEEDEKSEEKYAEKILKHDKFSNNSRIFIPASKRIETHNNIRNMIFQYYDNAVVVVLNGKEKSISIKNKTAIDLDPKKGEISYEIFTKIKTNEEFKNKPIFITGFICLGMGQTLVCEELGSFTHAIISHSNLSHDDVYQLFGRITGRMKNWSSYEKTILYCPENTWNICRTMEDNARNIMNNYRGEYITETIYNQHINKEKKEDNDKDHRVFNTQEEAIRFGLTLGKKFYKRNNEAPKELLNNDGTNPTSDKLVKRMWGINEKNTARMVPLIDNKWCVYWRPSLIK